MRRPGKRRFIQTPPSAGRRPSPPVFQSQQRRLNKKMDYKKLSAIIPMLSVAVMIAWGVLGNDWGRSWIAVAIGGILSAVFRTLAKDSSDD